MTSPTSPFPLSPLQQGLLFHSVDAGNPGVDIEQVTMILEEALDPAAWDRSWAWAADRHSVLRTSFHWSADAPPFQQIHADAPWDIRHHDWSDRSPAAIEAEWEQLIVADRQRGFDPAEAPLWRMQVLHCASKVHRVLFTFHHLLLDARALTVLLKEVFAAYEAFKSGRELTLPAPVTHHSYIDWLSQQASDNSEPFWRHQLRGFSTPTPLPGAGQSSATEPCAGHRELQIELAPKRTAQLRAFAAGHGLSLNTLVQGAWALLLSRYSGEDDVLFGAVRACRRSSVPGADSIVGLMINTVPMRIAVPPTMPVLDWLRSLRSHWNALRPHEHTPLPTLRALTDLPSGAPLFETVVSYQEPSWDAALHAQGGAWKHRHFGIRNQPNTPLALDAAGGDSLLLKLSFDAGRFSQSVIARMLGHLGTLLLAMPAHPSRPLGKLPLLTTAERKQLLVDWNLTHADYADDLCVHHLFEEQAARTPDALAVQDEHIRLTYGGLNKRAGELARHLHQMGVGADVCVVVCLESSVQLVVALLAVLKAGGAYVPVDPAYPRDRIAFLVEDSGAPVVLTTASLAALIGSAGPRVIALDEPLPTDNADAPSAHSSAAPIAPSSNHLAYVIYTSGSTGVPKGVAIRHRNLANLLAWHQRTYQVTAADRATQIASPAFDACVWELWPYLTAGASIHIPAADVRSSPSRLAQWLAQHRITLSFVPTPLAEALLDETWPANTSLRALLTGGDRLRRWPGRRLPCMLANHYGPTECTVVATCTPVPAEDSLHAAPAIGIPIANTEVYVLDRNQQPVPIGVAGELHVGGAGLARGYHRRPELTAEKFIPHPFRRVAGHKLYRTGDLVRWREDGQLEFLGRLDDQVKVRGYRIEPGEIEAVLNTHLAVRESLVLTREDAAGQAQLIAYVLARSGPDRPDASDFTGFLRRRLPAYMVPSVFMLLDAWPLTTHGKVDRARLPLESTAGECASDFVAPGKGMETEVAALWSEVLGRSGLGANDDFFGLGGHSLRAAQVVSRLNARFHTSLSVRHLFEHPTIAGLTRAIEQLSNQPADSSAPALVRLPRPAVPAEFTHS